MVDEQRNRLEALVEDMRRHLGVMAEANGAQEARSRETMSKLDRLEAKFDELTFEMRGLKADVGKLDGKVDKLDGKVDKLEGKVDKLEAFANDAGPRLVRIETHLALPALPPRQDKARLAPSKTSHRRKPLKRN